MQREYNSRVLIDWCDSKRDQRYTSILTVLDRLRRYLLNENVKGACRLYERDDIAKMAAAIF